MIEDKIEKLKAAVEWFYGDEFKLDEATKRYEAALKLAREIEHDLEVMKNKVEVLGQETA
jgi:exodeoxyribonuclease VII small subunit